MKLKLLALSILLSACTGKILVPEEPTPEQPAPTTPEVKTETVYVPVPTPGPTVTVTVEVPTPVTPPTELQTLVSEENDYRVSTGSLPLTKGLICSLYNLSPVPAPSGPPVWYQPVVFPASLPSAVATFTYLGNFNQDTIGSSTGIDVLPAPIRPLYTQWYALRCSGQVVVEDNAYYSFSTTSDDASLLYIDGVKVVDNDGNHGTQTRSGMKLLRRGVHTFKIDYTSGPGGGQALTVSMDGTPISADRFYK